MVLPAVFFSNIPFSLQTPCTIAFLLVLRKCLASYFPEKNNSFKYKATLTYWIFNCNLRVIGLCPFLLSFCFHGSIALIPSKAYSSTYALNFEFSYLPSRHLAPSGLLCPASLTSLLTQFINMSSLVCTKQIILIWTHILFSPLSLVTGVDLLSSYIFLLHASTHCHPHFVLTL